MERKEDGKKETTTRRTSIRHRRLVLSKPTGSRLPVFFPPAQRSFYVCVCVYIKGIGTHRAKGRKSIIICCCCRCCCSPFALVSPYSSTSSHRGRQLSTRPSSAYTCDTVFCECMYFRDFPEQKKVDRSRGGWKGEHVTQEFIDPPPFDLIFPLWPFSFYFSFGAGEYRFELKKEIKIKQSLNFSNEGVKGTITMIESICFRPCAFRVY
jgi:hypothetical protein